MWQNDVIKCHKMMSPHSNVCCDADLDLQDSLWTTYTHEFLYILCQLWQNDVMKCHKMMSPHSNVCCNADLDLQATLWTTYTHEFLYILCQ